MSLRILLVEPSRTQAQILSMILSDAGYDVDTAVTSEAALQKFADRPADSVIVNYTLPDESGSRLCQQLKSGDRRTCVLVIAESGCAHQILESLAAGADGFCIKTADMAGLPARVGRMLTYSRSGTPVLTETVEFQGREYQLSLSAAQWLDVLVATLDDLSELRQRCRELSGQLAASLSASAHNTIDGDAESRIDALTGGASLDTSSVSPMAGSPAATVLLAEDSATNQILGMSLLEKSGFRVLVAADGEKARAHLEAADSEEIAFVLMDVEMPGMDGLEATRRIRALDSGSREHLPILAMTAHVGDDERQACLDAGMDACLEKPLRMPAVFAALAELRAQTGSATTFERAISIDDDAPKSTAITLADPIVDWDAAMAAVCGEADLLRTVIEAVFQEWPGRKADLEHSIATQDEKLLRRTADSIAGLLRTFQPEQRRDSASDLAHQIEKQSGSADAATLVSLATRLCEKVALFIAELEEWVKRRS